MQIIISSPCFCRSAWCCRRCLHQ